MDLLSLNAVSVQTPIFSSLPHRHSTCNLTRDQPWCPLVRVPNRPVLQTYSYHTMTPKRAILSTRRTRKIVVRFLDMYASPCTIQVLSEKFVFAVVINPQRSRTCLLLYLTHLGLLVMTMRALIVTKALLILTETPLKVETRRPEKMCCTERPEQSSNSCQTNIDDRHQSLSLIHI